MAPHVWPTPSAAVARGAAPEGTAGFAVVESSPPALMVTVVSAEAPLEQQAAVPAA